MPRTPEQKQAAEQLEAAIRASMRAEGYEDGGVVVDYMTIVTTTAFMGPDSISGIFYLCSEIPYYRMLGMLDFIITGMRAQIAGGHQCPPET